MSATPGDTSVATVQAGSTIGFMANSDFYHPGYFSVYMSPASPAANSPEAGTGQTWFKVWEDPPVYENGAVVFPLETSDQFTFAIPKNLPSGQYLIRGEQVRRTFPSNKNEDVTYSRALLRPILHIALHVAETFGGAQFYIGCAQVNVVNGGSGTPDPLVSIPGVYTGNEPGILIYNLPTDYPGYTSPGPTVWSG